MSSLNIINTTEITESEKGATEKSMTGRSKSCQRKLRTTRVVKTQVCKYFKKGKCTKGDVCCFSHEDSHTQRIKCDQNRKSIAEDDIAEEEEEEEEAVEALSSRHPSTRGQNNEIHRAASSGSSMDEVLAEYPDVHVCLDEKAMSQLEKADPERVRQIFVHVMAKGDVQNVSAFVAKCLSCRSRRRGGGSQVSAGNAMNRQLWIQKLAEAMNSDFD